MQEKICITAHTFPQDHIVLVIQIKNASFNYRIVFSFLKPVGFLSA